MAIDDKRLIIELIILFIGEQTDRKLSANRLAYYILQRIPCLQKEYDKNLIVIKHIIELLIMELRLQSIGDEKISFKQWIGSDVLIEC